MNPIVRFFSVLALSLTVSSAYAAETVIDQLYGLRNYEMADAYWAAGQRFADLGQAARAAEFKAKALRLYPGYVPGQTPKVNAGALAVPAASTPQLPEASQVREQNLQGEKIVRLQFQKMLRGYLTGSGATMASGLGPTLSLQGQPTVHNAETLNDFLSKHPPVAGSPDELFLTDTLDVTTGPEQRILLTVTANPDSQAALGRAVPFWKPTQTYTFDRFGDTWKLIAVDGQ